MNESIALFSLIGAYREALDDTGEEVITKFLRHFNHQTEVFNAEEVKTLIESLTKLHKIQKDSKSNNSKYFVLVRYHPPH